MSTTSRQIVLGLGLAGLLVEAIVSHPALAVDKVKLFKVTTPKTVIVIGLTRDELDRLPGKDAGALKKVIGESGAMKVWQYAERRGVSGEPEQAPLKPFVLTANAAVQIEPYRTQLRIAPITEEKMVATEVIRPLSSQSGTYLR